MMVDSGFLTVQGISDPSMFNHLLGVLLEPVVHLPFDPDQLREMVQGPLLHLARLVLHRHHQQVESGSSVSLVFFFKFLGGLFEFFFEVVPPFCQYHGCFQSFPFSDGGLD